MAASTKNVRASVKSKAAPQAQSGWFSAAAAAAKNKNNQRTARNVGIGAALGTAGVLMYQHFAG